MKRQVSICMILFAAISMVVPAQDAVQERRVTVRQRLLPVMVFDAAGKPVKGLKLEDFELRIDDEPVPLRSVDERDYTPLRTGASPGSAAVARAELPPRRILFIFDSLSSSLQPLNIRPKGDSNFAGKSAESRGVDDPDSGPHVQRGARWARAVAAKEVLRSLLPTDEVAILEVSIGPNLIQGFTADRLKIEAAIDQVVLAPNQTPIPPPISQDDLSVIENEAQERLRMNQVKSYSMHLLSMYERLGNDMARLPGVKQVILFSEGFPTFSDLEVGRITEINEAERMSFITSVLASSGTRVSTISIAGIDREQLGTAEEDTLATLAADTGGEYFRPSGRIDEAVNAALTGFDLYYELFFTPPGSGDGKLHRVEVRMRDRDLRVRAPKGYLDSGSFDQNADVRLQAAMDWADGRPFDSGASSMVIRANLIPLGPGAAALHLRAIMPSLSHDGQVVTVAVNLGRGNTLYDRATWQVDTALGAGRQFDLLLMLPAGETSYQFVAQGAQGDVLGQYAGAFSVPETMKLPVIGPVYLAMDGAESGTVPEPAVLPKLTAFPEPHPLSELVRAPEAGDVLPGQRLRAGFVAGGFEIERLDFMLVVDGENYGIAGEDLESEPLSGGLKLVSASFTVPDLDAGDWEIALIGSVGGKRYQLSKVVIRVRDE